MIIDRTKNSLANFYALVKASNPSIDLSDQNVIIGTPEAYAGPNGTNTRVQISSIKNKGYSGTREVYYKRCTITEGLTSPIASLTVNVGELVGAFAGRIIAALNLLESEVVVNSGAGWSLSGNQVVTAKANSLVYLPNAQHTVNAINQTFVASFEVTLGSYTSIPYKETVRQTRWASGVIGNMVSIELDSGHSPAIGTTVGSIQKNSGGVLSTFCHSRDVGASYGTNMGNTVRLVIGANTPAGNKNVKLTNLATGQNVTLAMTPYDYNGYRYYQSTYDTVTTGPNNLANIGLAPGGRLGIDFL